MKHFLSFIFLFFLTVEGLQAQTVSGTITSASDEALIGVSVSVKDKDGKVTAGTVSDLDGKFSVSASPDSQLEFSYIGFKTQNIKVGNQTGFNIVMKEDSETLEELVVIGYGVVKKSDLTGAVSSIKADELKNTATAGIESALQGKIPGVFINKKSGKPGETADVKIRGVGSFEGTGPLWIIDGVQQDPKAEFNMNDAESVEILRDGSAAAIYGAAAANGVILVTTKRGKNAAKMSFNSYIGITNPTNLPEMLNSRQIKTLRLEDFNGKGAMTEAEMLAFPSTYNKDIRAYALDFDLTNRDYDWRNQIFSQGITQNYDLSFSKGNDDFNYYASFNYYDEKGVYIDTDFKRYSFRLNSDIKINKWLSFGESMQMTYTERNPESNNQYLNNYMRTLPFMMPYDENNQPGGFGYFPTVNPETGMEGWPTREHPEYYPNEFTTIKNMLNLYDGSNLLADELTANRKDNNFNVAGNVYAKLTPFKDLVITATLTGGVAASSDHGEIGQFQYYKKDQVSKARLYSQVIQNLSRTHSLGYQTVANYHKNFNNLHDLTVMLGSEGKKYYGITLNGSATNMLADIYAISRATQQYQLVGDSYSNGASMSFFGRINYAYADKYLLMALVRRDGYDRFSPKNRWGNFPSFSGAWKIGDESFIHDNERFDWLSGLKLRASWGLLGNSGIPQFLYLPTYVDDNANYAWGPSSGAYGEQQYAQGIRLEKLPNEYIKWEEISTTDVGLDAGLFKNALLFSFDWYIKNTSDALFKTSLPGMAGLGKNAGHKI
ncbi:MAG: SusC/RagA family TonB-linked outer membrane protein, partial [Dysgonamonadaceae bacterium]|nr:SusC/RagA family TonB-linked outer membrane protein [Dysgonamonadaceae bacterium]